MGSAYDDNVAESQAFAALQHSLFPDRRSPERRLAEGVSPADGRKRLTLGGFTGAGGRAGRGAIFEPHAASERPGAPWRRSPSPPRVRLRDAHIDGFDARQPYQARNRRPSPLEGEGGPKGRMRGRAGDCRVVSTYYRMGRRDPSSVRLRRPPSPSRGEGLMCPASAKPLLRMQV